MKENFLICDYMIRIESQVKIRQVHNSFPIKENVKRELVNILTLEHNSFSFRCLIQSPTNTNPFF